MLQRFQIIFLCTLGACLYGIVHDQITVRICLGYFVEPVHPPIFGGTHNPTLLALGWGVIATWWVGFFLGFILGLCCTVGRAPKITPRQVIKPLAITLTLLAILAALSGLAGHLAATRGMFLDENLTDYPRDEAIPFATTQTTHLASYTFGALLGLGLCAWAIVRRWRMATAQARLAGLEVQPPKLSSTGNSELSKS